MVFLCPGGLISVNIITADWYPDGSEVLGSLATTENEETRSAHEEVD